MKRAQDVYRLRKGGDVENAILATILNPDLPDARADRSHWLPIHGIQPVLNPHQFHTEIVLHLGREALKSLQGIALPDHRFDVAQCILFDTLVQKISIINDTQMLYL